MRIQRVRCENFRSLSSFNVNFPEGYSVICGRNNSGKSAIFKAIFAVLGRPKYEFIYINRQEQYVTYAEDISHWKKDSGEDIIIEIVINSNKNDDSSFYEFITRISKQSVSDDFSVTVSLICNKENWIKYKIRINGSDDFFDETATEETLRWLRDKAIVLYHDSTSQEMGFRVFMGRNNDLFNPSEGEKQKLNTLNKQFTSLMNKVSKRKKEDIENVLGNLGEKYVVNIDYPEVQFDNLPYDITLGESRGNETKLENWGSGTRNRTLILSLILQARQIARDINHSKRFSPIVLIEEPESFLHPSAQSGFGRVIEDLSKEFNIQIVTSSHSPFLLSRRAPGSNLLLERSIRRGKQMDSVVVDTSGENWAAPFATALGISTDELHPWIGVLHGNDDATLVVEGDLDKQYIENYIQKKNFNMLSKITITAIGGKDKLNDISMIRFISKFSKKVVFLLDLDAQSLDSKFAAAGLVRNRDYMFVGKDISGKRRIEGILPDEMHRDVYSDHSSVVISLQSDVSTEKKAAQARIKQLLLEKFKEWLEAGKDCGEFDKFAKHLARCFDPANGTS